jgi:enoyl-[acyl-carrier protein] reductase I
MKKIKQKLQKAVHDKDFYSKAKKRQEKGEKLNRELDLTGKKAVIFGVATDKSIAWSIAKTLNDHGCKIALGYQERVEDYVKEVAKELDDPFLADCDMVDDDKIDEFFSKVEKKFGRFDILVHSVAFAKKDFLEGKFYNVDRKGFNTAQEVSAFSLAAIVRASAHLMNDDGAIIAMTYMGSVKAIPNYNIMGVCKAALESSVRYIAQDLGDRGIRSNAISAAPIPTLAASGVKKFNKMLEIQEQRSLMHRNISAQDVADLALFLASDLSKNITGQILYVDAGYNVAGL